MGKIYTETAGVNLDWGQSTSTRWALADFIKF